MKKIKVTSLICGGMISLAGTTLLGQTSSTSPGQSSSSGSSSSGLGQSSTGSSSQYQGSTSSSGLGSSSSTYGMQGQHMRLSELMHAPVQGRDGKQLGHIRDFTVDPQSGRIEFAILSLGAASGLSSGSTSTDTTSGTTGTSSTTGTTGTSSSSRSASDLSSSSRLSSSGSSYGATGKLIPVPWQLFSESWSGNTSSSSTSGLSSSSSTTSGSSMGNRPTLTLNIDESKLQSAPSFQASNWNELQQSSFAQQVYSHFGVSQTSATGMPGSSISGEGTSGSKSYGGSSSHGSSSSSHGNSTHDSSSGSTSQPQK